MYIFTIFIAQYIKKAFYFKEMKMESNVQSIIKVIIVEDYKLTRVGLRCALNDFENIQVVGEAASGEEGLEKIFELKPDVVLMDLGLPKMNGLEVLEQVKKRASVL